MGMTELLRQRLAGQGLGATAATGPTTVVEAVRRSGGIQAQAVAPARLAVRARTRGLVAADVDDACARAEVVRSWLMRGTIHMVPAADLRWLLSLFGPVNARNGRRRRDQLGLTDEVCARGLAAFSAILQGGCALTRAELVAELAGHGVALDIKTQAPAHLLFYAAAQGLICRGPDAAGDEPAYVLLDEWIPPKAVPGRAEALAELVRRYLAAYAPATAPDFVAWSGLPATEAKAAFADVAAAAPAGPSAGPPRSSVHLLGAFDAYLLGHRSRDPILDPRHAGRVNAGGGMISPVILLDGRVVGTWKLDRSRKAARFELAPFGALPKSSDADLDAEIADVARFLGVEDHQRA